jgi:hypothetical protein
MFSMNLVLDILASLSVVCVVGMIIISEIYVLCVKIVLPVYS